MWPLGLPLTKSALGNLVAVTTTQDTYYVHGIVGQIGK